MKYKILMLCIRFPYPPKDGGAVAMYNMIEAFHEEGHEVTVFAMNTSKHYVHIRDLPAEVLEKAEYHAVDINTSVKKLDLVANLLFSKKAYHVQRFESKGFSTALENFLKEKVSQKDLFDYVQLETVYMASYLSLLRKYLPDAKIILRAHNVEQDIWKGAAENENNPFKQYYLSILADRISLFEKKVITNKLSGAKLDAIVTVSKEDAKAFKKLDSGVPIHTSWIGLDVLMIKQILADSESQWEKASEKRKRERQHAVFHIGSMDWRANQEGVNWFLKKVWPRINKRYPESTFLLAGRNMPLFYRSMKENQVTIVGEVESAYDFMLSNGIMVVPLFEGSGMRVKILEGMALKRPIVATPTAVKGIPAKHGQHLLIAESAKDFANCVSILLENPELGETMGRHAYKLVENSFDYRKLVSNLTDFYGKLK
ncbi:MAG: glycosyltransferase family 4 protein [Bacteroidota bacterium]